MNRRTIVMAVLGAVLMTGCGGNEPEQQPAPQPVSANENDNADAERRAAEERARRQAEMEAERRAMEEAAEAREILAERVHFDYDQSSIRAEDRRTLTNKVEILRRHPEIELRIAGHADERGSAEYNLALGMRRANAVKDFLTGYGLDASRFETVSFGEERPMRRGSGDSAWAANRRGEFTITRGEQALNP